MLQRIMGKENSQVKNSSLVNKMIENLKQEKQIMKRESEQRSKLYEEERRRFIQQIQAYKKKVIELTEMNILNTFCKKETYDNPKQVEGGLRIRKLEIENQYLVSMISEKQKLGECLKKQIKDFDRKYKVLLLQKQKHLELSLIQKIGLEEKLELFEKQVASKKRVIEGLKKELQKANEYEVELGKKERVIDRRGKDLNKEEEEFEIFYQEKQRKLQRKIQNFQKENCFLREQIKKIVNKIKKSCTCEGQTQQWKQKLFEVGKQLVKAKVELGKVNLQKQKAEQRKHKKLRTRINSASESSSSSSLQSFKLSDQSPPNKQKSKLNQNRR